MSATGGRVVVHEDDDHQHQLDLPPGFRFHPTDEELISHYLYEKVMDTGFVCRAIGDVDLNKSEPWDLPWKAKMGEKEWYFFCVRDRKYPTGLRTNRATEAGYWKATGKDKEIYKEKSLVGMKKTLVFYRGRAPKGEKSNWVIHEFRLDGKLSPMNLPKTARNEWVICRVFKKNSNGRKVEFYGNSILPPLTDSSPFNGEIIKTPFESPYVSCFSNAAIAMDDDFQSQRKLEPVMAMASSFNTTTTTDDPLLFTTVVNPNPYVQTHQNQITVSAVPPANLQLPGSVLMQEQEQQQQQIFRALLLQTNVVNNGSNLREEVFKPERENITFSQETCLTNDINNEISSSVSRRPFFQNHEPPSSTTHIPPVDIDSFWNY